MEQCCRSPVRFKAVYLVKGVADGPLGKDSTGEGHSHCSSQWYPNVSLSQPKGSRLRTPHDAGHQGQRMLKNSSEKPTVTAGTAWDAKSLH